MSQIFLLKYLGMCKNPLISTAGGRFHFITVQGRHLFKKTIFTVSSLPRAWLEPSHSLRSLRGLKAHAIPAGQGRLRQRYIARRKLVCIFEESPPSVPINEGSVLHDVESFKRQRIPATGICETPAGGKASMRPRRA